MANEQIDKCMISMNGVDILEIDGDAREDVCVFRNVSGSRKGWICAEITKELHSCILKVDSVTAAMRGFWTFTLENVRYYWSEIVQESNQSYGSPLIRTASVDVSLITYEADDVFMDANGFCTNNFWGIRRGIKNATEN